MSRLRVVMLIQRYFPHVGGAERQLAALIPALRAEGIDVEIVTQRLDNTEGKEEIHGTTVHRIAMPGPKRIGTVYFTLAAQRLLARLQPDVIHAHGLQQPTTTAILYKRRHGTPVVAKVLRGGKLGDIARIRRNALSASRLNTITTAVDVFVAISDEIDGELAAEGVATERRSFIPNGVDTARFAPTDAAAKAALRNELGLPAGPLALFAGRLVPEKRVGALLDVWPTVCAQVPSATLVVLGDGDEAERVQQAAGNGVLYLGHRPDVYRFMQACDVFVLPSTTEGLSNAMLEALASGMGVVITAVGGATDLIKHRENGWLIEPGDNDALTRALATLLGDHGLSRRLGAAGRTRVAEDYALEVTVARLVALYRRLAAERSS